MTADGRTLAGGDASGAVTLWGYGEWESDTSFGCAGPHPVPGFLTRLEIGSQSALAKPAGEPADTVWLYKSTATGPHRSFGPYCRAGACLGRADGPLARGGTR